MNCSDIRARARERLTGQWGLSIGIAALASLLGGLIIGASFLPEVKYKIPLESLAAISPFFEEGIRWGNLTISFRDGALGLASFLLGGALQLGYASFLLKQHDRRQTEFNDLFSQFHRFGQGFAQRFLRSLFSALWALLLIIPGVIAALRYAMTPYIMAEHPDISATEAIDRSKELMEGHKWDLFVLRLSFIGWDLLAAMSLNLGNLWLNPYKNAAEAAFYREITRRSHHT